MSLSVLLLAALPAPPPPCAAPAAPRAVLPPPTAAQESPAGQEPPAGQGGERERQEPPPKKAFDKLSSAQRKKARAALAALKGGRTEEARAEGAETLAGLGEGAVPLLLGAWQEFAQAERLEALLPLVDALLAEDALHLAWAEVAAGPDAARAWVVARFDASGRKDVADFLAARLAEATAEGADVPDTAYAAARGLLRRGDARGWQVVAARIEEHWTEEAAAIRADFAGLERGPFAAQAAAALDARKRAQRLAGLRLFELFGVADHAAKLLPALADSDTSVRLAAIDAARAAVDGDPPLERPSMTDIIQRAEAWQARIRGMRPAEDGR